MSDNVQAPRECSGHYLCISGPKCKRPKDANSYHLRVKSYAAIQKSRAQYRAKFRRDEK